MPSMRGKFTTTPQPKVELGQIWQDKNGTHRVVVAPLSEFEVYFSRIPDGYRTKVQRVSKNGAPSGNYKHVAKEEPQDNPVHIRYDFGGERAETLCGLRAEGLITTTVSNLRFWKRKARNSKVLQICRECMKRHEDGVSSKLPAEAA